MVGSKMPTTEERIMSQMRGTYKPDTRKGDRHKPWVDPLTGKEHKRNPYIKRDGKKLTKWERRKVVAWDGEGANLTDGTHIYNLLANSEGDSIVNHTGLTTAQCLEFFLRHGNNDHINVVFGGSYDVNMLLVDVSPKELMALWTTGWCSYGPYRIGYAHRKRFSVSRRYYGPEGKVRIKKFILWDVLGFFQTSFVNACRKWLKIDSVVLDAIEAMKFERSEFTTRKIDEIIDYNKTECELLVKLMSNLFDAMDEAEIRLTRYDGAGAIAGALLRKHKIHDHKGQIPDIVNRFAQHAYSGGRIEAIKIGNAEGVPIHRYDINSAYPSACRTLPSYAGAEWDISDTWNGNEHSMVVVEWDFIDEQPYYPLWYRDDYGAINYPVNGTGTYWGSEILAMAEHYLEGKHFNVLRAVNVELASDDKPFAFLDETYEKRRKFKEQGRMANEALKLGMNSIYGKLAQQAGYRDGRLPTYHQLLWAGKITADTRAKLYRASMESPNDIIAFATDAIISLTQHDLTLGTGLGEWTYDSFDGITMVQAGVYFMLTEGGKDWSSKYRGFDKGSLDRAKIVECWRNGDPYQASLTRFVTLGSALHAKDMGAVWRKWLTMPRVLDIWPQGKRQVGPLSCFADQLCDTIPSVNLTPEAPSRPYPLLWIEGDKGIQRETIDGIDIRLLEEEWTDSYA